MTPHGGKSNESQSTSKVDVGAVTTPTPPPHVRRNALDRLAIEHAVDQLTQAIAEIRALTESPHLEHDPWATDWRGEAYVYVKDILQILERHGLG